ncbi:ABC transporter ATP-binding protein [Deltaproteobacteria bacterium OttesenSCG-928-M10]|nr:ABC transporter ATP-binding protein [Deltaproteobacteria bacterium OttesenSCG-928-M10]
MTGQIELGLWVAQVQKNFGSHKALKGVDLEVRKGEFFTLLGPSGCGKTTLLRIIAGLELPDSGHVLLGGQDITRLPAAKRQVNTVFQSYALFPHLNIFENVAFGLKARQIELPEVKKRVGEKLEMLGLDGLDKRYPHQLSGGQKQRVALARALVNEPDILLLDEPMSALDAHLRTQVQEELRRLQRELKQTFILVTHDQDEAMVVSDRLAVMRDGLVEQVGAPRDVYSKPRNQFVAEFLGAANIIQARRDGGRVVTDLGSFDLSSAPQWDEGALAIRPEHIVLGEANGNPNWVRAKVREAIYRGQSLDVWLAPGDAPDDAADAFRVRVRTHTRGQLRPGDQVGLFFPPEDLVALDKAE